MTRKRDGNYLWVTWLSKLMAGDAQCQWGTWYRVHYSDYVRAPSDFQLAQWTAQHNQLLSELADERASAGDAVFKEAQNQFRIWMTPTLLLSGKPDLVAVHPDRTMTVFDAKTGNPRQSDLIQVMLYMLCLPAASSMHKGRQVRGCVVYRGGDRSDVPPSAITAEFKKNARYFVDILDADGAPKRVPSGPECRFCDLTRSDCSERIEVADGEDGPADVPSLEW